MRSLFKIETLHRISSLVPTGCWRAGRPLLFHIYSCAPDAFAWEQCVCTDRRRALCQTVLTFLCAPDVFPLGTGSYWKLTEWSCLLVRTSVLLEEAENLNAFSTGCQSVCTLHTDLCSPAPVVLAGVFVTEPRLVPGIPGGERSWKQANAPVINIASIPAYDGWSSLLFNCKILQKNRSCWQQWLIFSICIMACPLYLCNTAFAD